MHGYLGVSAVLQDYLPKRKFPIVYPIIKGIWMAVSVLAVYGLYQFNTNSIGICSFMKKLWSGQKEDV